MNYENFPQSVFTILHSHKQMCETSGCFPSSPIFQVVCFNNFCHSDYLANFEGTTVKIFNTVAI